MRQRAAGEHTNLAAAIALQAEKSLALAHAQELHDRREPPLALVERRIHTSNELLELSDVHRPARRLCRTGEDVTGRFDNLLNLRRIDATSAASSSLGENLPCPRQPYL